MASTKDNLMRQLWIVCPPQHIANIKRQLREFNGCDTSQRIVKDLSIIQRDFAFVSQPRPESSTSLIAIPTTLTFQSDAFTSKSDLGSIGLNEDVLCNSFLATRPILKPPRPIFPGSTLETGHIQGNIIARTVHQWLNSLPADLRHCLPSSNVVLSGSWRFHKYTPLLILPLGTFTRVPWSSALAQLPNEHAQALYAQIATALNVSHIAEQGAIPRLASAESTSTETVEAPKESTEKVALDPPAENVLRAPFALRPLYGDFGAHEAPSPAAFDRALWVTVRQHGIAQVFAPLHSMFSNGNVGEKRRIMEVAAFSKSEGSEAAVDLYAGIGYFAFSFAQAGYHPVLCWELNGWSLEGLRRGAKMNRRTVYDAHPLERRSEDGKRRDGVHLDYSALDRNFLLFHETNALALQRIEAFRHRIPPIRHVSCGYLPSSNPSWVDAIQILDPKRGGWVHAHENCAVAGIERRAVEIEALFQRVVDGLEKPQRRVWCEHVERVKSYAPGVIHCVFDMHVEPAGEVLCGEPSGCEPAPCGLPLPRHPGYPALHF